MKEQIIEVLRECPDGLRLRQLAMYLQCNRFALLNDINELRKAGIAKKAPAVRVTHSLLRPGF